MRFVHVKLRAPERALPTLAEFYGDKLALPGTTSSAGSSSFQVGETMLEFIPGPGAPFYHFALLVPGNRFEAALAWARERAALLPDRRSGDVVFDFDFWQAKACYFHDPAGSIVELIAHRGVNETAAEGEFEAAELAGLSELGLVGDLRTMAASLGRRLGLEVWDGSVEHPGGLAFVGKRARTLILAPPDRGWLPTGRAAELHDLDALLSGKPQGEVLLERSRYRIGRSGL
jgi:catechol 2,3-dioxygenase-like lactoylglutathione lyase family enzyme